jgi:hypothetical protein
MKLGVRMKRNAKGEEHVFTDLFQGFEQLTAVKGIFGERAPATLRQVRIQLIKRDGYLRVDNETGRIIICAPYLRKGDRRHIYLDLIHELVHVRQFFEGKELYDNNFSYVDRPTEIEAYAHAVKEARRIGLSDSEIEEYLEVEWVNETDFRRMLGILGVKSPRSHKDPRR